MKAPTKLLLTLTAAAAFSAAMLAFSHDASAVTVEDEHFLGNAGGGPFPPSDSTATDIVNLLISMPLNGSVLGFEGFDVFRSGIDFGSLPTAVLALNGTGTNITIGSGVYSYLLAAYSGGQELFGAQVWYIGNLSGDITIPAAALIGWTLFGPGVPDGGTTVILLGTALGALGMVRRYLKN